MLYLEPWHLGQLHAIEKLLVGVIAFGPFAVLAVVVYVLRRRDLALDEAEREPVEPGSLEQGRFEQGPAGPED